MKRFIDIVRMIAMLGAVIFYIAVFCLIGDSVTNSFEDVNEAVWNCSWNEFPLETQKSLLMILAIMQKPIYIKGFLNVRCTRVILNTVNSILLTQRRVRAHSNFK